MTQLYFKSAHSFNTFQFKILERASLKCHLIGCYLAYELFFLEYSDHPESNQMWWRVEGHGEVGRVMLYKTWQVLQREPIAVMKDSGWNLIQRSFTILSKAILLSSFPLNVQYAMPPTIQSHQSIYNSLNKPCSIMPYVTVYTVLPYRNSSPPPIIYQVQLSMRSNVIFSIKPSLGILVTSS